MTSPQVHRRRQVQVKDPMAPVRLSPVHVNHSEVAHQAVEILNDEGAWECINIHSPLYQLIPNQTVQTVTSDILAASELSWHDAGSVWTGRYFAQLYASDGLHEVHEVGDTLCLGLRAENSYDGSCQFRLVLQAYVLSCSNGLVSPRLFRSFAVRHMNGNGDFRIEEAINVISSGMSILEQIAPRVSALSRIPLDIDLLGQVARETKLPDREWGHITRSLEGVYDLWGLMQIITNRLTHNGRGRAGLLAQEVIGDYFLCNLVDKLGAA